MVDITPIIPQGRQIITKYGEGKFSVSGKDFNSSIIIFPDRTIEWSAKSPDQITLETLAPIIKETAELDILIIGCGSSFINLPPILRRELSGMGLAVEMMDTGAACRTYNVLLSEERRVAAALISV